VRSIVDSPHEKVDLENIADKICELCLCSKSEPSVLDKRAGHTTRQWGLRHGWGTLCKWCRAATTMRYGYMNSARFQRWRDEDPQHGKEAMIYALAYRTLREESKVQITNEMLEHRADLLTYAHFKEMPRIAQSGFQAIMLLQDYVEEHPNVNPVAQRAEIVQMRVGGKFRLGVRVAMERPPEDAGLPDVSAEVPVALCTTRGTTTEEKGDLELLSRLAMAAAGQIKTGELKEGGSYGSGLQRSPSKFLVKANPGSDSGSEQNSDKEDGEGVEDNPDSGAEGAKEEVALPKGRLGTSVGKLGSKVQGLLAELNKDDWRRHLKDTTLRALMRTAAGLQREAQQSEHATLIDTIKAHVDLLEHMQSLSRQSKALTLDYSIDNVRTVTPAIQALRKTIYGFTKGKKTLNEELLLLEVC
jgi:hypothetical protein